MSETNQDLAVTGNSALDALRAAYPQDAADSYEKKFIPQLRFRAKTVLDDDDKVKHKAGTFLKIERSEEQNAEGKYDYTETDLGLKITGDVIYARYRLSMYDAANDTYVSTPIFDDKNNEVVKLFSGGSEIASGTKDELQAMYKYEEDGKKKDKLKLQKVLYVLIDGVLHELALGTGNMYRYADYLRSLKPLEPSLVHTEFTSEKTEYGGNKYNQLVFKNVGALTEEEAVANVEVVKDLIKGIQAEKAYYGTNMTGNVPPSTEVPELEGGTDDGF